MMDHIVVLTGGVGGAKLASGLLDVVAAERLTFIVNTGDDFWHLGLRICPDLDTTMYTLAGLVDSQQGWGMAADTVATLDALQAMYGEAPWFKLGDQDLATHLLRSDRLRRGHSLTEVTRCLSQKLGIGAALLPMCDAELPTIVDTLEYGELGFQEYFVKHRWRPTLRSIRHEGAQAAELSPAIKTALGRADAILIAPSNPWLSVAPILAVPGLRQALADLSAPKVAVTPIIAGAAVKGPTAKIMRELNIEVGSGSIVSFYRGIINGFIDDVRNETLSQPNLRTIKLDTLMRNASAKAALADGILNWMAGWSR